MGPRKQLLWVFTHFQFVSEESEWERNGCYTFHVVGGCGWLAALEQFGPKLWPRFPLDSRALFEWAVAYAQSSRSRRMDDGQCVSQSNFRGSHFSRARARNRPPGRWRASRRGPSFSKYQQRDDQDGLSR